MKAPKKLRLLITIAVLVLFLVYFSLNIEKFKPILKVNLALLLIIAAANIMVIMMNGLFTKFILEPFKKRIPVLESFYVSLISSVGNFFAPAGTGFGFRAVYLKKKFGLPYSEYLSTLAGNYVIVFLVNSFFGLLALYLLKDKQNAQYNILVLVFAAILLASIILSLIKIPGDWLRKARSHHLSSLANIFNRITQGWNEISANRKLMFKLIVLTIFNFSLTVLMTWLIIKALHFHINFAPLLLFSVLGTLSLFINLTPANLGVKEAIYIFSSTVLGFTTAQILSIALIDRGVLFLILFIMWIFSNRFKGKRVVNTEPS